MSSSARIQDPATNVGSTVGNPGLDELVRQFVEQASAWTAEAEALVAPWEASGATPAAMAGLVKERRRRVNDILTRSAILAAHAILRAPATDRNGFYRAIAASLRANWTRTSAAHPAAALTRVVGQRTISTDAARKAGRAIELILRRIDAEHPTATLAERELRVAELLKAGVNNLQRPKRRRPGGGHILHGPGLTAIPVGRAVRAVLIREADDRFRLAFVTDIDGDVTLVPGPHHEPRFETEVRKIGPVRSHDGRLIVRADRALLNLVMAGRYEAEAYSAEKEKEKE